jgi:hypothetical protein
LTEGSQISSGGKRMYESFEIGEIAIYVRPDSPYYGQEVEVLSSLEWQEVLYDIQTKKMNYEGQYCYKISIKSPKDGRYLVAPPQWLKKKPSPGRDIFNKILEGLPKKEKAEA